MSLRRKLLSVLLLGVLILGSFGSASIVRDNNDRSYDIFVEIYSILWGGTDTVSAYSPIDGIEEDLGVILDVN